MHRMRRILNGRNVMGVVVVIYCQNSIIMETVVFLIQLFKLLMGATFFVELLILLMMMFRVFIVPMVKLVLMIFGQLNLILGDLLSGKSALVVPDPKYPRVSYKL